MSETEFQMFNSAFSTGAELIYAVLLTAFCKPFMTKWGKRPVLLCLICLAAGLLDEHLSAVQGSFGLLVMVLLSVLAGLLGLERSTAFLLAIFYWNARTSSGLIAESPYFLLDRLHPAPNEPLEAIYLRAAVLVTLFLLMNIALMTAMLYALQRQMRKRKIPLRGWELCCLSIIPAAGVLFGQMISRLWMEMEDGVFLLLYERRPAFLAAVPLMALLFYAGTYLSVVFWRKMEELREEQTAHDVEYRQIQAIRARIHEAERFYTDIRRLKHEMRGHLTNIKGLVSRSEYAGLDDYIAKMDESMSNVELTLRTGNPVTDVIVNDTQRRSFDLGIRFRADFHYPESGSYDAFDVGIILQNLLQNAMEACEKVDEGERFIVLTGRRKGRFFLIEVKNAFAGEVVFGQDGLPVTTKEEDVPMHGIGLSNVRWEAEKYMGECEWKTEQQTFFATVLLQERSLS